MASLSLSQPNYPNAPLESDIADEHHELNSDEEALPPRPTSRLGFNSIPTANAAPEVHAAPARSRTATLKWTKSLFQKIGISSLSSSASSPDIDMDITAAPIDSSSVDDNEDLDPVFMPILPSLSPASASTASLSLTDVDADTGSSCDDEYDDSDSDGYSSSSDVDLDLPAEYGQGGRDILLFPPTQPLPSPPTIPPPPPPAVPLAPIVSYVLPPAPLTPRAQPPFSSGPIPASSPPMRTKYSCLPSPLSPASESRISCINPLRHTYGHHGRSRHALLHLKYLWAMREDKWATHTTRMRDSYAYESVSSTSLTLDADGEAPVSARLSSPPARAQSPDCSQPPLRMPPMTIHPRRGDLSALRDPYCAHMDRCFVGMPLWTMGKTLWMYDVHVLAGHRERGVQYPLEEKMTSEGTLSEDEESGSEGENSMIASSISTAGFSDDSDETLVESDRSCSEDEGIGMEDVDLASDTEARKEDAVEAHLRSRPSDDYLNSKQRAVMPAKSALVPLPPRWETSWYKRFEVLLELVRLDTQRELAPQQQQVPDSQVPDSHPSPTLAVNVRSPRSRFFIGDEADDEEDWDGGEADDSWSEERWDEVLSMDRTAEDLNDDVMILSRQNQVSVY
ncbi:hypothetical protein B0H12DRAFT_1320898 [Mycena haematopus]|nr:hypothetical protein B0H12DRAFT_1320898 [Mycena haematopus]